MRTQLIGILLTLALVSSCKDDKEESSVPLSSVYDFVTLEEFGESGSKFTMQKSNDASLITYTSTFTFAKDTIVEAGERLIILYECKDALPYTSGPINLYGYRHLDNYPQQIIYDNFEPLVGVESDVLKIQSLTRTGNYLNMQAQLSCLTTSAPTYLCLTINEAETDQEKPKLKIFYKASKPGLNYFTGYASWDISALLRRATCKAVEIEYTTPTGTESQTFIVNNDNK